MHRSQKIGIISGALGTTVGGLAWLVGIGLVNKTPWLVVSSFAWGVVGFCVAAALVVKYPERFRSSGGLLVLWLVVFNLSVGNLIYEQVPAEIFGQPTGAQHLDVVSLNILLGAFSLFGFALILRDVWRTGEGSRK